MDRAKVALLSAFKELKVLQLTNSQMTGEDYSVLGTFIALEELYMGTTDAGDEELKHLKPLTCLRDLEAGHQVTGAGLFHLKDLRVRTLDLGYCDKLSAKGFAQSQMQSLEEVNMSNSCVEAGLLISLKSLLLLRKLILEDCSCCNADLVHMKDLLSLEKLCMNSSFVDDEGLGHVGGLRRLRTLDVSATLVTDAGVAHLNDLPCLVELRLEATMLTDLGVAPLINLPYLQELRLSLCGQITDGCIPFLLQCKNLKSVWVRGTQITPKGRARLELHGIKCH